MSSKTSPRRQAARDKKKMELQQAKAAIKEAQKNNRK